MYMQDSSEAANRSESAKIFGIPYHLCKPGFLRVLVFEVIKKCMIVLVIVLCLERRNTIRLQV